MGLSVTLKLFFKLKLISRNNIRLTADLSNIRRIFYLCLEVLHTACVCVSFPTGISMLAHYENIRKLSFGLSQNVYIPDMGCIWCKHAFSPTEVRTELFRGHRILESHCLYAPS